MKLKQTLRGLLEKRRIAALRKSFIGTPHQVADARLASAADYRKQGFSLNDSATYDLKHNDYRDYISTWESYQPRLHKNEYAVLADNKYLFGMVFGQAIKTAQTYAIIRNGKLTYMNGLSGETSLADFIRSAGGAVIKDAFGSDGFDIYVIRVKDGRLICKGGELTEKALNALVAGFTNGLVQELLTQGAFENALYPNSINTVRVITMRRQDSDAHEIIAAIQRIGTSQSGSVDNFFQGGASAPVDIESGVIGKMTSLLSVDETGRRVFYSHHPDTGAPVEGARIPHWESLAPLLADVTQKIPYFGYLAWDVVVQDDGFALIEVNLKSSLNVFQIHGGLRHKHLGEKYREKGFLLE